MDPTKNPFAPGAGIKPPELAGRDQILTDAEEVALARLKAGTRACSNDLLLALRGVGKTVLLNRNAELAAGSQYLIDRAERPRISPLAEMLVPPLRPPIILSTKAVAEAAAKEENTWRALTDAPTIVCGRV